MPSRDPYSARVIAAFEQVGPAVIHVAAEFTPRSAPAAAACRVAARGPAWCSPPTATR